MTAPAKRPAPLPDRTPDASDPAETRALFRLRLSWWLGVAVALAALLWLLGPILTPFAVGAAMAYVLDPLVSRLARRGVPRAWASAGLVLVLMAVLVAGVGILVPLLAAEAGTLLRALPGLYADAREAVAARLPGRGLTDGTGPVGEVLARLGESLTDAGATIFGGVLSGLTGLVRVALFWVVMPVVAFYLLMDWPRLLRSVDELLPRPGLHTLRGIGRDIDRALSGYLRGVLTVCTVLSVYYALTLTLAGLTYGLLVGVVAGAISFIPYVGAFVGGALAIGLALYQFWDTPLAVAAVVGIFLLGQFLESQILVPRLVGSSINLHPVWLIFAVMAFGGLFGLVGAIVAVPLAAAMGVIVRFMVAEYRASCLYGRAPGPAQD